MSKRQTSAGSEVGPDRQRRLASLGLSALGVVFGDIGTMGHFGAPAIKLAWFAIVFPGLILNYAGQAALVLDGAPTDGNIFFRLCRDVLLLPLIVLATVATIIASQSIITGAFSMTRQAIQLGWLPRLRIKQTSSEGCGQIYVGVVNWFLEQIFAAMERNAQHVSDFFRLPNNQVVEIGRQVAI